MKNMDVLTKEQKEYIKLKFAMDRMHIAYKESDKPSCMRATLGSYDPEYYAENQFYLFIEMLEGKHNDFLQYIIDRTK